MEQEAHGPCRGREGERKMGVTYLVRQKVLHPAVRDRAGGHPTSCTDAAGARARVWVGNTMHQARDWEKHKRERLCAPSHWATRASPHLSNSSEVAVVLVVVRVLAFPPKVAE